MPPHRGGATQDGAAEDIIETMSDKAVWIVIPVHNRRETTRRCLANLRASELLDLWSVCVVDDGSTDGTAELLEHEFPEVVRVVGSGELFWGGGIECGMRCARDAAAEVIVWLNDDCRPDPGSLVQLVARVRQTRGICGGFCVDESRESVTYSGWRMQHGRLVALEPGEQEFQAGDLLNGNLVAVHRDVWERIGILDSREFRHYGADPYYTLKAQRAGAVVEVCSSAIAINAKEAAFDRLGIERPPVHYWRELFAVKSPLCLRYQWKFRAKVFGWYRGPTALVLVWQLALRSFRVIFRHGPRAFWTTKVAPPR
jgi:GT2 family glycosyltransferase